ncbi:phosphoribosylglycinamide formyltransferase 2 [Mycobacterium shigaense]|uniref:Phosphoribosylglycinamide formyltransferase 2 n=1 Tax=Mycobacterium shigaense TaxID=722731 RepID=A0A1Z4ECS3_9MYCO|nr:phosphoribosylglycinamide formyltransferase 2 [Mycobacterium shigaense]
MLLGSDELSRELAIALRHLGAEVIAVDDHPDAPAHAAADQSVVIPMTDAGELSALIKRLQPDFVVTASEAVALDALDALVAGFDNDLTELVPGARSVRLTADREGLRRLAADELGLPTAPFWFAGSLDDLKAVAAHAGSQLLVEPVRGPVGQRRSVIRGPGDIEAAWQRAVGSVSAPEQQRVLAETVVDVEFYVTLLAIRSDGPNGPVIEFCSPIGHGGAQADAVESWQPQQLSPAATDAAKSIAARIVKALGGRGVFSVELMINGDEVYFASVSTRLPPTAWVTLRSQRLSVFELQARAILGLPVDTLMISPAAARSIRRAPDAGRAPAAAALSADALAAALGVPETDLRVFGRGSARLLGVALAMGPDVAGARARARDAAAVLSGVSATGSQRPS